MTDEVKLKRQVWKTYCRANDIEGKFDPARVRPIWEFERAGVRKAMYVVDDLTDLRIYETMTFLANSKVLIAVYEYNSELSGAYGEGEENETGEDGGKE